MNIYIYTHELKLDRDVMFNCRYKSLVKLILGQDLADQISWRGQGLATNPPIWSEVENETNRCSLFDHRLKYQWVRENGLTEPSISCPASLSAVVIIFWLRRKNRRFQEVSEISFSIRKKQWSDKSTKHLLLTTNDQSISKCILIICFFS